jgi:hypothetical protein
MKNPAFPPLLAYFYGLSTVGNGNRGWVISFCKKAKISENNFRQIMYRGCSFRVAHPIIKIYEKHFCNERDEWIPFQTGRAETTRRGICHTFDPRFIVMEETINGPLQLEWIDEPMDVHDAWTHLLFAYRMVRHEIVWARWSTGMPIEPDAPDRARWVQMGDWAIHTGAQVVLTPSGDLL